MKKENSLQYYICKTYNVMHSRVPEKIDEQFILVSNGSEALDYICMEIDLLYPNIKKMVYVEPYEDIF